MKIVGVEEVDYQLRPGPEMPLPIRDTVEQAIGDASEVKPGAGAAVVSRLGASLAAERLSRLLGLRVVPVSEGEAKLELINGDGTVRNCRPTQRIVLSLYQTMVDLVSELTESYMSTNTALSAERARADTLLMQRNALAEDVRLLTEENDRLKKENETDWAEYEPTAPKTKKMKAVMELQEPETPAPGNAK